MTCALPSVRTPPTVPPVSAGGDDDARCLGVDIGGTTIKYAVVDPVRGTTVGPVRRLPTPVGCMPSGTRPDTPRAPVHTRQTIREAAHRSTPPPPRYPARHARLARDIRTAAGLRQ